MKLILPPEPCSRCGGKDHHRSMGMWSCDRCANFQRLNNKIEYRSVCCPSCGNRQATSASKAFKCFKCGKSTKIRNNRTGQYESTFATMPTPKLASEYNRLKKLDDADRFGVNAKKGANYMNLEKK